jgi:hypothetical protein
MTQEEELLFESLSGYALDNLFWSLIYADSAVFATPLLEPSREKLLGLYRNCQTVLTSVYPADQCGGLVEAMGENNRLFTVYVELLVQGSDQAVMARQRWKESGQRLAQLLSQLNSYWRVAEWTAMINHETDLLDAIVTGMKRRNYSALVDTASVCRRLAFDMSKYLYGGVEKQAFSKESLAE